MSPDRRDHPRAQDSSPRHLGRGTGTAVPAAGPHRAAPLVHQPAAADPHLRHQPARPGRAAHVAGAPVRAMIPIPNTTGNVTVTFGALSYAGTLRITVVVRSQPGTGRGRAHGRPAPGPRQRGPLTGAAEAGCPCLRRSRAACAAHAHIIPIWTLPLALHSAAPLAQITGGYTRYPFQIRPGCVA